MIKKIITNIKEIYAPQGNLWAQPFSMYCIILAIMGFNLNYMLTYTLFMHPVRWILSLVVFLISVKAFIEQHRAYDFERKTKRRYRSKLFAKKPDTENRKYQRKDVEDVEEK